MRLIGGILLLMFLQGTAFGAEGADFQRTLQLHLQAIADRNLDSLLATVSDEVDLIFPNGQLLRGKQAYRDFHVEWFADDQWRFEPQVMRKVESAEMATVLLRYELRDVPEPGQGDPREAYLVLVFQLIDGSWQLVHDQNTRIPAAQSGD